MDNSKYCADLQGGLWFQFNTQTKKWMAKPCCLYKKSYVVSDSIQTDFWSHPEIQKERLDNLNGKELSENCAQCKIIEQHGNYSRRQSWNERLGTSWNNPQSIVELDVQADFSCNLACRICSPQFSTMWRQVEETTPAIKLKIRADNNNVVSMLNTIPTSDIRQIHFQGGEPLLSHTHIQILERLQDTVDFSQLVVWYHSNGTTRVSDKVLKFWEKFKMIELYFSLDDLGPRFEYQRWPLNWNKVSSNLEWFRTSIPHNGLIRVERTISTLSAAWVLEFDQWAAQNFCKTVYGDDITINYHDCFGDYSIQGLSTEYKEHILETTPADHWINRRMSTLAVGNSTTIKNMFNHLNKHDKIRDQDWRQIYPEFLSWYNRYL